VCRPIPADDALKMRLFVAGHKKEAATQRRPHLVPRPLFPHPRGGYRNPTANCVYARANRYGKLKFLDCCKFATIGELLRHVVVSLLLSAQNYSIRPKAGQSSPSPDTPWPLSRRSLSTDGNFDPKCVACLGFAFVAIRSLFPSNIVAPWINAAYCRCGAWDHSGQPTRKPELDLRKKDPGGLSAIAGVLGSAENHRQVL
jgi:hypothetical protein